MVNHSRKNDARCLQSQIFKYPCHPKWRPCSNTRRTVFYLFHFSPSVTYFVPPADSFSQTRNASRNDQLKSLSLNCCSVCWRVVLLVSLGAAPPLAHFLNTALLCSSSPCIPSSYIEFARDRKRWGGEREAGQHVPKASCRDALKISLRVCVVSRVIDLPFRAIRTKGLGKVYVLFLHTGISWSDYYKFEMCFVSLEENKVVRVCMRV